MLKRLLAVLFVLLSLAGLGLCVAGIVGAWWVKQPLLAKATRAFESADRALAVTDDTLDLLQVGLEKTREDLKTIRTKSAAMAKDDRPDLEQRMISRVVAQQLGPKVQQVRKAANIATEASIVINSLLEAINQLPQTAIGPLDTDRLGQVRKTLSGVTQTSQQLSDLIEQTSPGGNTQDVTNMTRQISDVLDDIETRVVELHERVTKVQSDVTALQPRVFDWIHKGPIVVSGVLGWLALSQIIVFVVAVSWFRSRTPPGT
jgi:methyl-accepting chemotaxis protein